MSEDRAFYGNAIEVPKRLERIDNRLDKGFRLHLADQRWLLAQVRQLQRENEDLRLQVKQLADAIAIMTIAVYEEE
jgi:hypothetical protein